MARCSGCVSDACNCYLVAGDNVTLTGAGVSGDPYTISTSSAACRSTIIVGSSRSTPVSLRGCADFLADGSNDQVEIQAAIDAAKDLSAELPDGFRPDVFLLPGVYFIESPINTRGVALSGPTAGYGNKVSLVTNAYDGGPGGNRIIEESGLGLTLSLENLDIEGMGGAGVYTDSSRLAVDITNCTFGSYGDLGADPAHIVIENVSYVKITECLLGDGVLRNLSVQGFGDSVIVANNWLGEGGLILSDMNGVSGSGPLVTGNNVRAQSPASTDYVIELDNTDGALIQGNKFHSVRRGIIRLTDSNDNAILGNIAHGYDPLEVGTVDGIRLSGTSSYNNVQGNTIRASSYAAGAGRHGVNVDNASCVGNFIVNNDLLNSGTGASLNDAGTSTITAAGNRI